MKDVTHAVLKALYMGHKKNPVAHYNVSEIIRKKGFAPHEIGEQLIERGLIKNHHWQSSSLMCQITRAGIDLLKHQKEKV